MAQLSCPLNNAIKHKSPSHRDFSRTRHQTPALLSLKIFPETKHYFFLRNSCLLCLISTVSTVILVINRTKPSFMQIFVYLISFVRGMQDVYQHHIWRLARNCDHSIKIWRKRKFKIRTLLFRKLFQWS